MNTVRNDIANQKFRKIYLLTGEERYLRNQYRDKLKSAMSNEGDEMNVHVYEGKDINIGEVIDLAETMPFLADRRLILITESGLFKSGGDKLADYLENQAETVNFVFNETDIDKRSHLYKAVMKNGYVATMDTPDQMTLRKWIGSTFKRENMKISEEACAMLIDRAGTNMANLSNEMEKLICYCMGREAVTAEDVEIIGTNVISTKVFDMINAIGEKNSSKAFSCYFDMIALKEPAMRIITLLSRQFSTLLQVKVLLTHGTPTNAIATQLNTQEFIVKRSISQAKRFSIDALRHGIEACADATQSITTGKLTDTISLEILINTLLAL